MESIRLTNGVITEQSIDAMGPVAEEVPTTSVDRHIEQDRWRINKVHRNPNEISDPVFHPAVVRRCVEANHRPKSDKIDKVSEVRVDW